MDSVLVNILGGKYNLKMDEFDVDESYETINGKLEQKIAVFKLDMETELNTVDNPKKDILFSKAWDLSNKNDKNNGLESVYNYYNLLVELIK